MKKTLLALSVISGLSSLSARELWCEQCEPEPQPCCPEHLFVERSQFFVTGEFLYWTALVPNLHYALQQSVPFSSMLQTGDFETTDYDWDPGFRVSIAYYRCPKYWEATAEYTWFHNEGSDSAGPFVRPTRDVQDITTPFQNATSSIELDYQLGDLYVARVFDPNPHLRLRLIGGITGGYIEQDWKISYTDAMSVTQNLRERWRYWGVGLKAALRADWFWWCQFYVTGKVSFATLAGCYKNTENQIRPSDGMIFADSEYKDSRFAYTVQFILGPSWQVPCDCWSFELFAGYESNIWFNLHERYRAFPTSPAAPTEVFFANGMFGVHGLTVRLTLGF